MTFALRYLRTYFRKNLGAPFLILFLSLLIFGFVFSTYVQMLYGVELARNNYYPFLNIVGVAAYFSLVVGVVLQLISFKRQKPTVDNSEESVETTD